MSLIGIVVSALIGGLFSGLIIYFIGKMGWGIEVDGFRPAYLAAVIIALLSGVIQYIWTLFGVEIRDGLSGGIINAAVTAVLLQFAGERVNGLRVKGFSGALLAAAIIGIVAFLLGLLLASVV